MTPENYKYTKDHEWICQNGREAKIGITDFAQHELGDIVYVDLPPVGTIVEQAKKICEIESVKAVAEILSPASGSIIEINQAVIDEPKILNEDPYNTGWLLKIELSDVAELNTLMSSDDYEKYLGQIGK